MTTTRDTVPADLQKFMDDLHKKVEGHATRGDTDAYLELWSHTPDASIMAAVGGNHIGYGQVAELLHWVSPQLAFKTYTPKVLTVAAHGDIAFSVELEEFTSGDDDQLTTLRTTHVFRRENGQWKLLHRHSEPLTPVGGMPTGEQSAYQS